MSTSQNKNSLFLKLAFYQAEINLGSTSLNPSVGCVVVKNNSVISSGRTSFNGRPHAEANALKKKKILMVQAYI
jgi:diaminohydroxyphosphoribosylaminopyrimidine deaminase/5-amino-6-(5-phosphoribosylamino)uracil reductase